jgi:hypothetical protein
MTTDGSFSGTHDRTDDDYELTAEEAFARLSPQERRQVGRMMKQEGRRRHVDFADVDDDDDDDDDAKYDNPKKLARMARRSKKKDPGMLGNLLESFGGGGGGGGSQSGGITDLAKSALKKIT